MTRHFASLVLASVVLLGSAGSARAFESFASQVPNRATAVNSLGEVKPCINCHNNPDGGGGCTPTPATPSCLNPFGLSFRANGYA